MKELNLSAKELLVLAAHIGAGNFYGIKDPFCGMSRQEIEVSIPDIQLALEQKGYASVGFDSSFKIMPAVEDIVSVCAQCDKYIMIDVASAGDRSPKQMLYFANGQCIKLVQSDDKLNLSKVTVESYIKETMEWAFCDCGEGTCDVASVSLPKAALDAAKTESIETGKTLLQSYGCAPDVASVIASGLHQLCTYISLVGVDLRLHTLDALICIISPTASVCMKLDDMGEQDQWCVSWISREELSQELHQIIRDSDCRGGTENALL